MQTENALIAACIALIGDDLSRLSPSEKKLVKTLGLAKCTAAEVASTRKMIARGDDPLGDIFALVRSSSDRRASGAVYTPPAIVQSMITWLSSQGKLERIVDPGAGSGRFVLAAGQAFPKAQLIAVEMDPLAALMLRANLRVRRVKRTAFG